MLIGVDVGGTFTDAVLALDGRLITAKAPTTPDDQSEGVMAAIQTALEKADASAADIEEFSLGMTVATNALLEGRGARTAFVATAGFTDLIALGRQDRPQLYRLCAGRPAPLAPAELRFGAPERMTPDGPLDELTEDAATELASKLPIAAGTEATPAELREAFEREHEERYGYHDSEQDLELVTIRVTATAEGTDVELAGEGEDSELERSTREAVLDGRRLEFEVLRGIPGPGTRVEGPAVVELPESTLLIPPGWSSEVDDTGTIKMTRNRLAPIPSDNRPGGDSRDRSRRVRGNGWRRFRPTIARGAILVIDRVESAETAGADPVRQSPGGRFS